MPCLDLALEPGLKIKASYSWGILGLGSLVGNGELIVSSIFRAFGACAYFLGFLKHRGYVKALYIPGSIFGCIFLC